jgi:hypothetical protein
MHLARTQYWSEMRSVGRRVILVAVVVAVAIADLAHAQVFIDPDSPTGKEYEIPFEAVRRGAQPGSDPSAPIAQGERNAAPFGEGITGASPADGGSAADGGSSGGDGSAGGGSRSGQQNGDAGGQPGGRAASPGPPSRIVDAAASNPGAPPSSTGSTALYLGVGALALGIGVAVGVALRRRST